MILVFGGTTEGRKIAEILDFTGESYHYSTKTPTNIYIKGKMVTGAMTAPEMQQFCKTNHIKLLINAAHPFAVELHRNVAVTAKNLQIKTLRYERVFTGFSSKNLRLFNSFKDLTNCLEISGYKTILALTGVQTIPFFKPVFHSLKCFFRILNKKESIKQALEAGVPKEQLFPVHPTGDTTTLTALAQKINAQLMVTKESGESGYMQSKIKAAEKLDIPLWVVRKPLLPDFDEKVNSEKEFLKKFYLLKRTVLKQENVLRSGFTTGTCVTAAAKACFLALATQKFPAEVSVQIPTGEYASFKIFDGLLKENKASCVVIKDAGDDPDITHGREIGCELQQANKSCTYFVQGEGIGLVTLPGLPVAVGEPAINPVPQKMILNMLELLADEYNLEPYFCIKPFIPGGKELAKQTFNERVGVVNGLSVIGTTGKVLPYSHEAFIETIKKQFDVLKASDLKQVVLTSGKRSENMLRGGFQGLPQQAFIHFGNSIGESLNIAVQSGIQKISLGLMLGKAVKLAMGHLNTHSKHVKFNPDFIAQLAEQCGYPAHVVRQIKQQTIANAIPDFIPFTENEKLYKKIVQLCLQNCRKVIPSHAHFEFYLMTVNNKKIKL